nr:hypothetical protein [Vibrio sp. ED004]
MRTLANTIKKHVKALNGVVGRWGGEEFIVFFPKNKRLTRPPSILQILKHEWWGAYLRRVSNSSILGVQPHQVSIKRQYWHYRQLHPSYQQFPQYIDSSYR